MTRPPRTVPTARSVPTASMVLTSRTASSVSDLALLGSTTPQTGLGDQVLTTRGERCGADAGSATVWVLLMVPVLIFAVGLVVDGGRAISARQEAIGLASQAARKAVDQMDTGGYRAGGGVRAVAPGAAQAAACTWIGRYRPDASCTAVVRPGGQVDVTVTLAYTPVILGAAGMAPKTISVSANARPAVGDGQEVP